MFKMTKAVQAPIPADCSPRIMADTQKQMILQLGSEAMIGERLVIDSFSIACRYHYERESETATDEIKKKSIRQQLDEKLTPIRKEVELYLRLLSEDKSSGYDERHIRNSIAFHLKCNSVDYCYSEEALNKYRAKLKNALVDLGYVFLIKK